MEADEDIEDADDDVGSDGEQFTNSSSDPDDDDDEEDDDDDEDDDDGYGYEEDYGGYDDDDRNTTLFQLSGEADDIVLGANDGDLLRFTCGGKQVGVPFYLLYPTVAILELYEENRFATLHEMGKIVLFGKDPEITPYSLRTGAVSRCMTLKTINSTTTATTNNNDSLSCNKKWLLVGCCDGIIVLKFNPMRTSLDKYWVGVKSDYERQNEFVLTFDVGVESKRSVIVILELSGGLYLGSFAVVVSEDPRINIYDLGDFESFQVVNKVKVKPKKLLLSLQGHQQSTNDLVEVAPGLILASAHNDTTIRLWDLSSGFCIRSLPGHTNPVTQLLKPKWTLFEPVLDQHDALVSCSAGCDIRLWNVKSGECIWTVECEFINKIVELREGGQLALAFKHKRSLHYLEFGVRSVYWLELFHHNSSKSSSPFIIIIII